jgi:2-iminobutanoate/2-iminopropanoate deaminase
MDMGLPFTPGIMYEDVLYVSGVIGSVTGTTELPEGIQAQTRETLNNISRVLEETGMSLADVVSTNVYLADIRDYGGMNEAYRTAFSDTPPARATIEADIAVPGALLEISAIAVRSTVGRKAILPEGWSQPSAPYSYGILAGDTLYISGMVGFDPNTGEFASHETGGQAKQIFQNISAVLEECGMSLSDVVSTRVYLADARDFAAMNTEYRKAFPNSPPVRATVRGRLGNPALMVEVQSIAVKSTERTALPRPSSSTPFSPAVRVGNYVYLSGMVGRGPEGLAPGDLKAQTRQTIENLKDALEKSGMDLANVVSATVFLSDIRFYTAMNEVYREMMPEVPPARATVGSQLMSPEALVEIMMTAVEP